VAFLAAKGASQTVAARFRTPKADEASLRRIAAFFTEVPEQEQKARTELFRALGHFVEKLEASGITVTPAALVDTLRAGGALAGTARVGLQFAKCASRILISTGEEDGGFGPLRESEPQKQPQQPHATQKQPPQSHATPSAQGILEYEPALGTQGRRLRRHAMLVSPADCDHDHDHDNDAYHGGDDGKGAGASACEYDHVANTEEDPTARALTSAVPVSATTAQPNGFVDVRSKATRTDAELDGLLHLDNGSARGNGGPAGAPQSVMLLAVPANNMGGVQQTSALARDGHTATKAQDTADVVLTSPVRARRLNGMSAKSPSSASELAEDVSWYTELNHNLLATVENYVQEPSDSKNVVHVKLHLNGQEASQVVGLLRLLPNINGVVARVAPSTNSPGARDVFATFAAALSSGQAPLVIRAVRTPKSVTKVTVTCALCGLGLEHAACPVPEEGAKDRIARVVPTIKNAVVPTNNDANGRQFWVRVCPMHVVCAAFAHHLTGKDEFPCVSTKTCLARQMCNFRRLSDRTIVVDAQTGEWALVATPSAHTRGSPSARPSSSVSGRASTRKTSQLRGRLGRRKDGVVLDEVEARDDAESVESEVVTKPGGRVPLTITYGSKSREKKRARPASHFLMESGSESDAERDRKGKA
jgi:hypothetical protein